MKKAEAVLVWMLFAVTVLLPAGVLLCLPFGCSFALASYKGHAVFCAVLSVAVLIWLSLAENKTRDNKTGAALSSLAPLAMINTVFTSIFGLGSLDIILCIALVTSMLCCAVLTIVFGGHRVLKIVSGVLSVLMTMPMMLFCLLMFMFSGISVNFVAETVYSPSGRYYAEVIDSDQGALGGDTFVEVHEKVLELCFARIEKRPERVYSGERGEWQDMVIYFEDEDTLVINGSKREIG